MRLQAALHPKGTPSLWPYSAMLRRRPAIHPLSFLSATFFLGAAGLFPVYLAELAITGMGFIVGGIALFYSTLAKLLDK